MLVDIDQAAADSSFVDIVVVAELAADTTAADTEAAAAGIVQRQDIDKHSFCVDY